MEILALTPELQAARSKWRYRGDTRPAFAEPIAAGEESVWDFPRPPRIEPVELGLEVFADGRRIAGTRRGVRVCETAGAPVYYFPPQDVERDLLTREGEASVCEWKGQAVSFAVLGKAAQAWCYERVFPEFIAIRGWFAFYPAALDCRIDGEQARPQPGSYYGGWVTDRLRGPIKGRAGSEDW